MTSLEKFHRKEIVKKQLETAVKLFLNKTDLSSVITLSGAAANVLSQLIKNADKESFLDYARGIYNRFKKSTPAREKYNHYIDRTLGISSHKHMNKNCSEMVSLDLEQCACDALTRSISDYVVLYGQNELFIKVFLKWSWEKEGPAIKERLIQKFKNMSEKPGRKAKNSNDIEAYEISDIEKSNNVPQVYERFDLALNQLKTAIVLYITKKDRFSIITLSGAADVIFSELVSREEKETFADIIAKEEGKQRTRQQTGKDINDTLSINLLKHMNPNDSEYIEIDAEECALGAILKALANYSQLEKADQNLIIGFRAWLQTNIDFSNYSTE
jgi:hypothetical protein